MIFLESMRPIKEGSTVAETTELHFVTGAAGVGDTSTCVAGRCCQRARLAGFRSAALGCYGHGV